MFKKRIELVRSALHTVSADALLVSNFYNIRYLTGFVSLSKEEREAFAVITQNNAYILTDARYLDETLRKNTQSSEIQIKEITPQKRMSSHIEEIADAEKIQTLGFEAENLRYGEFQQLEKKLSRLRLKPIPDFLIKERAIKDGAEIERISKACSLTDQCLEEIAPAITDSMTEKEIASRIITWIGQHNAEPAFDPIIACDKNAALPHYNTKTGEGKVRKGSLILIDFGVAYDGYVSDITRMFSFGKPGDEIQNTYDRLLTVQNKTVDAVHTSKETKELDILCRKLLKDAGLPDYSHSTGHGVGLEVHEFPKISSFSTDILTPSQVFTVEPGVYKEGKWGMRIEDTVSVDEGLKPHMLTKFPKSLGIIA